MVQLNVRIPAAILAQIDEEVRGVERREGLEASRSQIVVYLLKRGLKSRRRPPIV